MSKKKPKIKRLPKEFQKYFWDVEFEKLSLRKHLEFILGRIMNLGDIKALKWLLNIPRKTILKVIKTNREIDLKTKNFWQVVYGQ